MSNFNHSYALVIGVDAYQNGITPLNNAVNDALAVANLLESTHGYEVWRLFDHEASYEAIQHHLKTELPNRLQPNDRLLFYFSGHGIQLNSQEGPEGYLIPQTAQIGKSDTYLSMKAVYQALSALPCRHFLGILDCCFAGSFRWAAQHRKVTVVDSDTLYRETFDRFIRDPAWQVITSAAYDQLAYDAFDLKNDRGQDQAHVQHSPFAAALLAGLTSEADLSPPAKAANQKPGDGVITATELYQYVRDSIELETDSCGARQTPGLYPLGKHDKGEYIFLAPDHPLNLPCAPALDRSTNPYKGLGSFDEVDCDRYFGRTAIAQELYKFFLKHQLTVVLGPSGSGKSSLVKAGLLPQLRKEQKKDSNWTILPPFRPGDSPFESLNQVLARLNLPTVTPNGTSPAANKGQALSPQAGLKQWLDQDNACLVVVIDQFEELVTRCQDAERQQFLETIATVLQQYPERLRLIVTLRSDFESQFQDSHLAPLWYPSRFQVPTLTRRELQQVIEEPAALRILFFDPSELVDQLIDEVINMPGGLPLLSFALSELYLSYLQRQETASKAGITVERAITQVDYETLGGVTRALIQRAEEEYEQLVQENSAYRHTIRQVMLRMVALGAGELARRPFLESEQQFLMPEQARVQTVIECFLEARLLVAGKTIGGESFVEPAHDALVQGWPRLSQWLKQGDTQETVLLIRSLTSVATQWNSRKQNSRKQNSRKQNSRKQNSRKQNSREDRSNAKGLLWKDDPRLPQAMGLLFTSPDQTSLPNLLKWMVGIRSWDVQNKHPWLNSLESEFVESSFVRKLKGRRNLVATVASVGSMLLVLTGYALVQQQEAKRQTVTTLAQASAAQVSSGQDLEASVNAMRAFHQFGKDASTPELEAKVTGALQQVIYNMQEKNRFLGHEGRIHSVALDPDGRFLASVSEDSFVMLWDMNSQKLFTQLCGHTGTVFRVIFSPDGKTLVSGDATGKVLFWNLEQIANSANEDQSDECLYAATGKVPKQDKRQIRSFAFSPDGASLAIGLTKGQIKLWDMLNNRWIETLSHTKKNTVRSVVSSPGGQMLVTASSGEIHLWDTSEPSPEHKRAIPIEEGTVHLAISPDSNLIAAGLENGTVKIWNVEGEKWDRSFQEHGSEQDDSLKQVRSVEFSADGKVLATSGAEGKVRLWDLSRNKVSAQLDGHTGPLAQVTFASTALTQKICGSGYLLATGGADLTVRLWCALGQQETHALETTFSSTLAAESFRYLAFGESDDSLLDVSERTTGWWNLLEGSRFSTIDRMQGEEITSAAFSPKHQSLAIGLTSGKVKIRNVSSQNVSNQNVSNQDSIETPSLEAIASSLAFSPDGRWLAIGLDDRTVQLWDVKAEKMIQPPLNLQAYGSGGKIDSLAFSPNSQLLAVGLDSNYGFIQLWKTSDWLPVGDVQQAHQARVYNLAFSSDGQFLASSSGDGIAKLWKVSQWQQEPFHVQFVHNGKIRSVAFNPKLQQVATGAGDGNVKLWDYNGIELVNIDTEQRSKSNFKVADIASLAFSSDGQKMATAGADGSIKIWQVGNLEALAARNCNWIRDYLQASSAISAEEKSVCAE